MFADGKKIVPWAKGSLQLQEVTAQIDKVGGVVGHLSAEQRKVLAKLVNPAMPALKQLFEKMPAIPSVADILKPIIDLAVLAG